MGGKKLWMIGGGLLLALSAAYVYVGVDVSPHVEYVPEPVAVEDTIPDPPSAYGIPMSGFVMEQMKVPAGATFSDLLSAHGLMPATIDSLVKLAGPVFDIHKMRAGHPFALIFTDDDARVPSYFVYEADQVEHVIFTLRPPMDVHVGHREVRTEEKSVSVAVTGALWNDLQKAGVDPALTMKLSEVFAWTVDFYRIQKGDRFTVVYREHTVDGAPYGPPEVLGVRYEGSYKREAFRFGEGGAMAYYDAEGNSLRKAFLKAPLKYSRVSSGFTMRRFHPVQKRYKAHLGTDYAAPYGTPILAVGDGVVEKAGYSAGNGNFVKIRHNGMYETQYLHMRKILVRNGQHVQQGQSIGEVGSTGLATGPHVCFRFWKNGEQVDHRREEFPSAEPVPAAERVAFDQLRDGLLARLDAAEHEALRVSTATF
ncbi:MAG TPA: peptidoglycan DD-metalloendopeptidase family protein [Flavobacteriales bacterium]|nr:peptidoglycan DD-metalloendopeptidase family protein [Flavobacteriales bacterium]